MANGFPSLSPFSITQSAMISTLVRVSGASTAVRVSGASTAVRVSGASTAVRVSGTFFSESANLLADSITGEKSGTLMEAITDFALSMEGFRSIGFVRCLTGISATSSTTLCAEIALAFGRVALLTLIATAATNTVFLTFFATRAKKPINRLLMSLPVTSQSVNRSRNFFAIASSQTASEPARMLATSCFSCGVRTSSAAASTSASGGVVATDSCNRRVMSALIAASSAAFRSATHCSVPMREFTTELRMLCSHSTIFSNNVRSFCASPAQKSGSVARSLRKSARNSSFVRSSVASRRML